MVFQRVRILPLLIIVALMAMSIRIGEIVQHKHVLGEALAEKSADGGDKQSSGQDSIAQLETAAGQKGEGGDQPSAQAGSKDAAGNGSPTGADADNMQSSSSPIGEINLENAEKQNWPNASDSHVSMSDKRMQLYKDLSKRRKELDKRAEKLEKRKALLKAAEKELDEKYQELKKLRNEIKALLKEQSKQKEERISTLVKIYSGMKADDAARIFNTLEINTLVEVMSRMSERNLAPILAEMESEKARKVTMMLAEEKNLPSMPEQLNN